MKPIIPLSIDPECSEELHQELDDLNQQIADHNQKMTELANDQRDFKTVDELDSQTLALSRSFGEREVNVLQDEKNLRELVISFDTSYRKELGGLRNKAHQAHEKAKKTVRAKLVKIGYIDAGQYENVPGKIRVEFITLHPEVIGTLGRYNELRSHSSSYDLQRNQEAEIERLETRLNSIRSKLVTI